MHQPGLDGKAAHDIDLEQTRGAEAMDGRIDRRTPMTGAAAAGAMLPTRGLALGQQRAGSDYEAIVQAVNSGCELRDGDRGDARVYVTEGSFAGQARRA